MGNGGELKFAIFRFIFPVPEMENKNSFKIRAYNIHIMFKALDELLNNRIIFSVLGFV